MSTPTDIEKESLEAHVELCAIRYNSLEQKLNNVENRIDKLEHLILDIKESVSNREYNGNKQTIGIFASVVGVLLSALFGFIAHGLFK